MTDLVNLSYNEVCRGCPITQRESGRACLKVCKATLKKSLFPVERPGGYFLANLELFSSVFAYILFKIITSFFYKKKNKKKKRFCSCSTGLIFGNPLDKKHTFLRVA